MIRHEAVCHNADTGPLVRLLKNCFKGSIVARLVEQWEPTDTPVKHMVGQSTGRISRAAGMTPLL